MSYSNMTNDSTNYFFNSNSRSLSKLRIYVLNVVDELKDLEVVKRTNRNLFLVWRIQKLPCQEFLERYCCHLRYSD